MFQYHRGTVSLNKRLEYSSEPFATLVGEWQELKGDSYRLFITISPNPNTKHKVLREVKYKSKTRLQWMKVKYKDMTHLEEYNYLCDYINRVYVPLMDDPLTVAGIVEMNKSGNLHAHMMIKSGSVVNDTTLMVFRRLIATDLNTVINASKAGTDYMNNIVRITKPYDEIVTYMSKTNEEILPLFKNFFLRNI